MRGQRSAYVKSSYSLPYDGDDREITEALEERRDVALSEISYRLTKSVTISLSS